MAHLRTHSWGVCSRAATVGPTQWINGGIEWWENVFSGALIEPQCNISCAYWNLGVSLDRVSSFLLVMIINVIVGFFLPYRLFL